MRSTNEYVLLLSCSDVRGIVHAVTGFLAIHECNILDSMQHGDSSTGTFCMRIHFISDAAGLAVEEMREKFGGIADKFQMKWQIFDLR